MTCHTFIERRSTGHPPTACQEHMPFKGHRTVAEVWEREARQEQCFWTEVELRTAARLRSIGWTRAEIAAELGRTPKAIKHMFERHRNYPHRAAFVPVGETKEAGA